MHVAINTALVIPALTLMLAGCAMFRIAGAITARHAAEHLVEFNKEQAKDALDMAYKLSGLIRGSTYINGVDNRDERYELSARLHNFLAALIVENVVLQKDIIDLTAFMKIDLSATIPYEQVKDIRYMVDAFIDVAERGLRNVSPTQDSESK